jgi:hypothetical protein
MRPLGYFTSDSTCAWHVAQRLRQQQQVRQQRLQQQRQAATGE